LVFSTGVGLLVLGVTLVFVEFVQTRASDLLPSQVGVTPLGFAGVLCDVVGITLAGIGLVPHTGRSRNALADVPVATYPPATETSRLRRR
jgi:hypothetical protein